MSDAKNNRKLFTAYINAQSYHRSALREVAEWDERLKDDTGGYRGLEGVRALEWEEKCREEMRECFDAYIAARFGVTPQPERERKEP